MCTIGVLKEPPICVEDGLFMPPCFSQQWFFSARSPRKRTWTLKAKWLMASAGWSAPPSTSTRCWEVRPPTAGATLPSGVAVHHNSRQSAYEMWNVLRHSFLCSDSEPFLRPQSQSMEWSGTMWNFSSSPPSGQRMSSTSRWGSLVTLSLCDCDQRPPTWPSTDSRLHLSHREATEVEETPTGSRQ